FASMNATTRIGPIGHSRRQRRCKPCPRPSRLSGSIASPYVDKIVSVESFTSTDLPLDLHGWSFRHAQDPFAPQNHQTACRRRSSNRPPTRGCNGGGRYWDRTSDLFGVNEALSR